mgnify:CR=1 FL=1
MSDTTSSIFDILKKVNTYPVCLHGPYSRTSIDLSMENTLQIGIAPIIEEHKGSKPQKGVNSYNNDAKVSFTLNFNDMYHIYNNWTPIITNQYVNNDPKCPPDNKNKFGLIHFNKEKKPSFFNVIASDKNKVTITIRDASGKTAQFMLINDFATGKNYSLLHFYNILKSVVTNGAYDMLLFQASVKKLRSALYDMSQTSNNNGGNNNYSRNNNSSAPQQNYNNSSAPQQQNYNNQPQASYTPSAASSEEMSEIDAIFNQSDDDDNNWPSM